MSIEYNLEYINDFDMKQIYNNLSIDTEITSSNLLKLNEKLWIYNDMIYKIINYDKQYLTNDMVKSMGVFRSVIINDNKIVSFSPPKSLNYNLFQTLHPNFSEIKVEEYVEGTMINLFWNKTSWDISTKHTVGGKIIFFQNEDKTVTFRNMFMEICNEVNLDFEDLNKDYCYSFVMQHPKNRIVIPFGLKKLYLVKVYKIDNYKIEDIDKTMVYETDFKDTCVELPCVMKYNTYEELYNTVSNMNNSYDMVGVMLHANNGDRSKVRNPSYEYVRRLRGNQPKLQYEYLSLRKTGKVKDFLKYYPEYKKQFYDYREQLHQYTTTLYVNYVNCYIKKEQPLLEYPVEFRTHMYTLHQQYINHLKDDKKHIHFHIVREYVNQLHPAQQMHVLNYNMKKQYIDCLKTDEYLEKDE